MIHESSLFAVLTYGTLTCAFAALWLRPEQNRLLRPSVWNLSFCVSLGCGLAFGCLSPIAVIPILAFGAACFFVEKKDAPRFLRICAGTAVIAFSIAYMLHIVPGFVSTKVIDAVRLGRDAAPYSKFLNFDKVLVGLFILALGHPLIGSRAEWKRMFRTAGPMILLMLPVILVLANALGYVRFDVKWPSILLTWAWTNLVFTCCAEEAFCRGFIQRNLERIFRQYACGQALALVLSAALFGIFHFSGGVRYVLLAGVSGLGYGLVYQRTRRIEASIIMHFLLNLTHILFFTYPALESAAH